MGGVGQVNARFLTQGDIVAASGGPAGFDDCTGVVGDEGSFRSVGSVHGNGRRRT